MGLGCMSMSGDYGAHDDAESAATLRRAVELGVTLFDTADVYGPFANEAFVAHALSAVRSDVVIATKFGLVRTSRGEHIGVDGSPDYVRRSCELSLQRMGSDHIDLYIQHRVDPATPIEETVGAMAELVDAGMVRYIGLSEAGPDTIRRAHAVKPLSVVQSEYSLWSRDVEAGVLPTCRELGIGFIAYSPLGRGFLTGGITSENDLAPKDYRRGDPRFQGEALTQNLKLVRQVEALAVEIGCTPSQLALTWVMSRGAVPIPGTKRRNHLEANVGAAAIELSTDQLARLEESISSAAVVGDRYADMSAINPNEGT
jgi:aryl-alcohol dehydrogenase-like predicted oxidoreductase